MVDLVQIEDAKDLGVNNVDTFRAKNIASTQTGEKHFTPSEFGVDLKYFLNPDITFQDKNFQSYIMQRLISSGVNVMESIKIANKLDTVISYHIKSDERGGLV